MTIRHLNKKFKAVAVVALGAMLSTAGTSQAAPVDPNAKARSTTTEYTALTAGPEDAATASSPTTAADDELACQKVRKRLWIDGEGWIVRRVNLCR